MQEKKSRKEWIKTIAIIFLSIMLVLTFFANTINNYSLSEVAVQYVSSDNLSSKIRGQGTVVSQDPYSVVWKQSRKIESVKVQVNDEVQKGDVIYVLEAGQSEEVKKAQEELEALRTAYEKSLITGQVSSSDRKAVENGKSGTIEQKQAKIDAAQRKVDQYKREITNLEKEINHWTNNPTGDIAEANAATEAQKSITAWEIEQTARISELSAAQRDYDLAVEKLAEYAGVSENDPSANAAEVAAKQAAQSALTAAKERLDRANQYKAIADDQLTALRYKKSANQQVVDNKIAELEKQLKAAEANKAAADAALSELVSGISTQLDLESSLAAIHAKEEEIEKLKSEEGSTEIVAPVSGTILSLSRVAGETTSAEETVATIQIAGKGFTTSMLVTPEQAAMINIGDEAEIGNSWYYSDVHAKVKAIRPDRDSQGKKKIVEFDLDGSVQSGTILSLTITSRKSANYDTVVPNSAIKEDNNGKYVYRLVQKPSPLGTRYSAERVNVTVIAEDDTRSAVSGALESYDSVITAVSKPITDGALVRLKQ